MFNEQVGFKYKVVSYHYFDFICLIFLIHSYFILFISCNRTFMYNFLKIILEIKGRWQQFTAMRNKYIGGVCMCLD
uniref:Uncharacterized protein n=1 Tax=Manihot esculenta TaxID=3983 RepID=A0A2C9V407_MANES